MDRILQIIQDMRVRAGWDKTDTLPILIKSVSIEAAELLETIQWDEENYKEEEVRSELADVLMYALSIAIDKGWDVEQLIREKIADVNKRYPEKDD